MSAAVAAPRLAAPSWKPPAASGPAAPLPQVLRPDDLLPVTRVCTVAADDGVPLRVEEVGAAAAAVTVVFVHGFCLHMGSWYFQRRDLPARTGARLVFYDQRGHGRSGRSSAGHCTIDQLGRDLATVIATVAPRGPVVLVGHSMGGMTIMALARQYPELFAGRVVGVALVSTAAAGLVPAVLRLGPHHPGCSVLRHLVVPTPWVLERVRPPAVAVLAPLIRALSYGDHSVSEAVAGFSQQMIAATPARTVLNFLPALSTHDERAALCALRRCRCPVLVCCGSADRLTPPRHTTLIGKALPAATLLVAPRAGHLLPLEASQLLTGALGELLEEASPRFPARRRTPGSRGGRRHQPPRRRGTPVTAPREPAPR